MMKLTRFFAVVFLVSFAAATELRAGTVEYPKIDPIFTVEVPDGWKSNFTDDGTLVLEKTGAELLCSIMPTKDITDDASAKASAPSFTELVKLFGMEDVKAAGPVAEVPLPNVKKAYGVDLNGKLGGKDGVCKFLIFAPKEGKYFVLAAMGTTETLAATSEDGSKIVKSITAK
ncbi:MAG: hypothetical protein QOD12_925 [Verrucomicrobiota bacterium]|jgi:hypothetical protein